MGLKRCNRNLIDYINNRRYLGYHDSVLDLARNHGPFMYQLDFMKTLAVHDGCVNTIVWNRSGEYILSGSDDKHLCITKPRCIYDKGKDYTVLLKMPTQHLGNIFCAQFMPNSCDSTTVSCSSEGPVIVHDTNRTPPENLIYNYNCHEGTVYEVVPVPDDNKVFLSCGEDKTIRLFDMRCHKSCHRADTCPHPALVKNSYALTTLALHPLNSMLVLVGRADGSGLVYDRRKLPNPADFSREKAHQERLASMSETSEQVPEEPRRYRHPLDGCVLQFTVPELKDKHRFTSLCYNANGSQVLASYSQDYVYLFDNNHNTDLELIQTLPKSNGNDGDGSSDNANRRASDANRRDGAGGNAQRRKILPRIRVRGDWSDTGVDSVPLSQEPRTVEDAAARRRVNFLQRVTEAAVSLSQRQAGDSANFIPLTELIAGPFNASSDNQQQQQQQQEGRDEANDQQGNNDEDGSSDEEFELDVECLHNDDDEEDAYMDDDDDDDDKEESAQEESISSEEDERSNRCDTDVGESSRARSISEAIKKKFERSFANLKLRINQIPTSNPRVKFQGHRNNRTCLNKAIFWGDEYIMSGSDCGRIMVWEKRTGKLIMCFAADRRVVNCLAPNPVTYALASSGVDYDIKLWSTQSIVETPLVPAQSELDEIIKRNEIMLEEARHTITVPPNVFFRMLASLAQGNT